jgi:Ca2+-transporting ATPase
VALQLLAIYLPFFNRLLSTQPLTWVEMGLTLALSSVAFWAVEIQKLVIRRRAALPPQVVAGVGDLVPPPVLVAQLS